MTRTLDLTDYGQQVETRYPVLGRIAWMSLSDVRISRTELENAFHAVGLGNAWLPATIQYQDAFRRATKTSQVNVRTPERRENFLLREVSSEENEIVQHLVCEEVDSKNRRLNFETVGVVIYIRPTDAHKQGTIIFNNDCDPAQTDRFQDVEDIGKNIHKLFDEYANYYNTNVIRGMTKRILRDCSTISVRTSGGVYFAPDRFKDTLDKVGLLYKYFGPGCQFHVLPLIDENDQRAMLEAAFEGESTAEIETLLDEIAKIMDSGKDITNFRYEQLADEFKRLKGRAQEYGEILDFQSTRTETALALFNRKMADLLGRVKAS